MGSGLRPNLVVVAHSHSRSAAQKFRGVQSSGTFTTTGLDTPAFSAFATASSNVSPTATMRLSSSERATQWLGGAFNNASARACDDAIRRFCAQPAEPAQDAKLLCSDDLGRNRVTLHFQRRRFAFGSCRGRGKVFTSSPSQTVIPGKRL